MVWKWFGIEWKQNPGWKNRVGNRQTRVDSYATGVGRLPILHLSANFEMQCAIGAAGLDTLGRCTEGHPGIARMKSLARMYVWWPGINKDIEQAVQKCAQCQLHQATPPPELGTYVCVVAWDQQGHRASCPEVCRVSTASGYLASSSTTSMELAETSLG